MSNPFSQFTPEEKTLIFRALGAYCEALNNGLDFVNTSNVLLPADKNNIGEKYKLERKATEAIMNKCSNSIKQ